MATNLGQLRANLNTELKINTGNRVWSASALNSYINQAYLQLQKDGQFNWGANQTSTTDTSVSGTAEYSLPTDFFRLDYIEYNNESLHQISKKEVLRRESGSIPQAKPLYYYIYGNNYGLYPTPDAAQTITILYRKRLATLSANATNMELPDDFAPAIVKYAAYLAWSAPRGNSQAAAAKLTDYQAELNFLLTAYLLRDSNIDYSVQRGRKYISTSTNLV